MWRASGALLTLLLLCVAPALAQQEMRSNTKGTSIPLPITGTVIDSNHNALDITPKTTLSGEDQLNSVFRVESQWEYEDVGASQTDQVMGATGAAGDLLHAIHCVFSGDPSAAVSVKDGAGSSYTVVADPGAAAVSNSGALDWVSTGGAWSVTTGTNTTCRVSGRFS